MLFWDGYLIWKSVDYNIIMHYVLMCSVEIQLPVIND